MRRATSLDGPFRLSHRGIESTQRFKRKGRSRSVKNMLLFYNTICTTFLTVRIFPEIFGGEGQNKSWEQNKIFLRRGFSENIARQNISRAGKTQILPAEEYFEEYSGSNVSRDKSRNILDQNNIWGGVGSSLEVAHDAWYRYPVHSPG